jgi:hypothetical protein
MLKKKTVVMFVVKTALLAGVLVGNAGHWIPRKLLEEDE